MSRIQAFHTEKGCYFAKGARYFMEASRKEHVHGAITGTVWQCIGPDNPDGSGTVKRVGSFRIEPDGTVSRGPAHFKALATQKVPEGRCDRCGDHTPDARSPLCIMCVMRDEAYAKARLTG